MAFTPTQYDEGKVVSLPFADAQTITKFAAVVVDTSSGYYNVAASGADDVRYIALETVTTTADAEEVLCLPVLGVRFIADCSDAPVRADDVGTFVDLASLSTLALGTSTDDVFYVEDIFGPTTDKKVAGYFMPQVAGA